MKPFIYILLCLCANSAYAYDSWSIYDKGEWQVKVFKMADGPLSCKMWTGDLTAYLELSYSPETDIQGKIIAHPLNYTEGVDKLLMTFDDRPLMISVEQTSNEISWTVGSQASELATLLMGATDISASFEETISASVSFSSTGLTGALTAFTDCMYTL